MRTCTLALVIAGWAGSVAAQQELRYKGYDVLVSDVKKGDALRDRLSRSVTTAVDTTKAVVGVQLVFKKSTAPSAGEAWPDERGIGRIPWSEIDLVDSDGKHYPADPGVLPDFRILFKGDRKEGKPFALGFAVPKDLELRALKLRLAGQYLDLKK